MSLPVFQATIVNDSGDIIPSAVMTVLDEITGLGLTVYSNRAGTVPLGTNGVFTAGADGFAQFFAPAGNYRVKAEQAASGFEKTWDFVPLVGGSAFDVDSYKEFGLGGDTSPMITDLKSLVEGGLYSIGGGTLNLPPNMSNGTAYVGKWITGGASESQSVLAIDTSSDAIWLTTYDGYDGKTWSDWKRIDPQAFGLGGSVLPLIADINSFDTPTQFGRTDGSTAGTFTGLPSQFGVIEFIALAVNDFVKQVWTQASVTTVNTIPASFERVGHQSSGIFTDWQPVYTGANYQPEQHNGIGVVKRIRNSSGSSISAGATVAGNLVRTVLTDNSGNVTSASAMAGTWKNVSGVAVGNNVTGDFMRTA